LINGPGMNEKTLAEYVIALHDESKTLPDFKAKLQENGAPFPESVIENMDRLILSMHPKHKKKHDPANGKTKPGTKNQNGSSLLTEKDKNARIFPGLSLPDQEWHPPPGSSGEEKDAVMKEVDDLMSQLEGVSKKARPKASEFMGGDDRERPRSTPRRDGRDREHRRHSPPHMSRQRSASPPRRGSDNGYGDRRGRYNDGPRGRPTGRGRAALDERAVLYKIYDGRVTGLKEFGAFVSLEGIMGRAEGRHLLPTFSGLY
jgi:ATP-dependent RNA helicase DHX8/PRP22